MARRNKQGVEAEAATPSSGKKEFLHIRVGAEKKKAIEVAAEAAEETVSAYVLKATTARMKKEEKA